MGKRKQGVDRRGFLKGGLVSGASVVTAATVGPSGEAQQAAPVAPPSPGPSPWLAAAEKRPPETREAPHIALPGSDYMIDVMKAAGIKYVAAMPGSTFRGLHESILNYAGNTSPELITCMHEEVSAGICHGYAKVAGSPMACLVHGNVGLQHASMGIFNAWCDRAPMIVVVGNIGEATERRPGVEWIHVGQDLGAMVRDFVKYDDSPQSLQHFGESFMRAREICETPPYEPVLIVADAKLQEEHAEEAAHLIVPKRAPVSAPTADGAGLAKAAQMLAAAQSPVIVADRAVRSAEGLALMVQLAELLNAPVVDRLGRMNFPTNHDLNHTWLEAALLQKADVVLGLELTDIFGVAYSVLDIPGRPFTRRVPATTKFVAISANYASAKSNMQDAQRYFTADLTLAADAETTLPGLIAALNAALTPARRAELAARRPALAAAHKQMRETAANDAARAWDASPVSTARLCQELWAQLKGEDWGLVSSSDFISRWPQRLWDIDKHYQYIGGEGGYGVGYGVCAAVGAALAHRDAGRIAVNIQTDGDLLVAPAALWTLAHHNISLLTIMHNNRAWHQETMHLQRMTNVRNRKPERAMIGTLVTEPNIDYAMMARSMGLWAEGPIDQPARLAGAIKRALAVVKSGKPALLDVVTQPR